jgi:acylglycerol lipase
MRHHTHLSFAVAAAAIVAAAATLAGCSYPPTTPVRLPTAPLDAPREVEHTDGTFAGVGGVQLYEQSWVPRKEPRASVVLVHGLKDHSSRYKALAERLAAEGFAVYAFDLRGHGRSEGVRVWVDPFDDYLGDLDIFLGRVRDHGKGRPTFLFGHSMGGAIVTLYTITHHPDVAGIVLSGAALQTDVGSGGAKFVAALSPNAGVFNLDLKQFSRDPAVVSEGLADPLVYQGAAPARTAVGLLDAIGRIQQHMEDVNVPLLAMHGEADKVTPPAGSKQLVDRAGSKDKTLKTYPNLYHDLLHEPERQQVTNDLVKWLNDHAPAAKPAAPPPEAPPPQAPAAPPAPAPQAPPAAAGG